MKQRRYMVACFIYLLLMAMSLPFLYRSDAKLDFLQVLCYQKKTSEGKEGMMGSGSALLFVHTVYYLTTL